MTNRDNLFYDAVNTVIHSHINCACNNAYRNIYPQFCGTSRHRPPLSLFFPPLQICYDTTYTFFVGAIIGRPFNMYPSSIHCLTAALINLDSFIESISENPMALKYKFIYSSFLQCINNKQCEFF